MVSVPRMYNADQLLCPKTAVGGWCEMVDSLRGREPESRVMSTVERRYQAAQ
jgi:hypothetical protein